MWVNKINLIGLMGVLLLLGFVVGIIINSTFTPHTIQLEDAPFDITGYCKETIVNNFYIAVTCKLPNNNTIVNCIYKVGYPNSLACVEP